LGRFRKELGQENRRDVRFSKEGITDEALDPKRVKRKELCGC